VPALHPHALRHACGAELLRRTKNLRVVQQQLRHVDIQTTTAAEIMRFRLLRKSMRRAGSRDTGTSRLSVRLVRYA